MPVKEAVYASNTRTDGANPIKKKIETLVSSKLQTNQVAFVTITWAFECLTYKVNFLNTSVRRHFDVLSFVGLEIIFVLNSKVKDV